MNELIKLWVSVTKGKEIEEFESDVQKLYDYTMNLQKENQQLKLINKEYIDIKLYNVEYLQKLLEQYQKIEIVEKVSEE